MDNERKTITVDAECPVCEGTGVTTNLWSMTMKRGAVCHECDGKGKVEMTYVPFQGIRRLKRIEEVFGYKNGQGSVSYNDFLKGVLPSEQSTLAPR